MMYVNSMCQGGCCNSRVKLFNNSLLVVSASGEFSGKKEYKIPPL